VSNYQVLSGSVFSKAGTNGTDLGWDATVININDIVNGTPSREGTPGGHSRASIPLWDTQPR
jgi:hypothetical protein